MALDSVAGSRPAGPAVGNARDLSPPGPMPRRSSRSRCRAARRAAQYRALARRRRESRASGFSTPSSSRMPTTTRGCRPWPSRRGQRADEEIQRALEIIGVQRRERVEQVIAGIAALELDAGRQAVRGEAAGHLAEDGERAIGVAAAVQEPRQRHGRVGTRRLELHRAAQRLLVAARHELFGLGGQQRVQETLNGRGGLGADELGDHLATAKRLDGGDALDAEGARHRGPRRSWPAPPWSRATSSSTGPSCRQGHRSPRS